MFAQHAIACVLCELLLELFLVFFQTLKRFLTSFSILFNFQGPVRLSLAADDLFILPLKWFFVKPYFLEAFEAFELFELGALQTSQCQLVFSASIGSFQELPAVASEVILLPQRLALKYNTTPPPPCQHFLTSFFQILCGGGITPSVIACGDATLPLLSPTVTFPHPVGNHPFQGRLIPTHHVPLEKGDVSVS